MTNRILNAPRLRSVFFALLALVASGCVYIPTPGTKPFDEEVVARIVPGKTTRTDVLASHGNPDYRYLDDRLFAYFDSQLKGVAISYGIGANFKGYYLLVEFDESGAVAAAGRVTANPEQLNFLESLAYGHDTDDKSCIATGFCLAGQPVSGGSYGVPLFVPEKMDAVAKRFKTDPTSCTVYLAIPPMARLHTPDFAHAPAMFDLDGRLIAKVPYDAGAGVFYRFRIDPGDHVLRQILTNSHVKPFKEQQPKEFSCKAGDTRFFEAVPPSRTSLFDVSFKRTHFQELDETKGRDAMRKNRLVIAPTP